MDTIVSSEYASVGSLDVWRQKLARNLLRALCILGGPVIAFAVYLAIVQDIVWQIPIRMGVYVLILWATFWPGISYRVQAWSLIGIFVAFGVFNLTQFAITAESFLFLIMATTLASLFFGRKAAIVMMLVICLILIGMAFAFTSGYIVVYYPRSQVTRNPDWASWLFIVFLFGALGMGLQYAQGYVLSYLAAALDESHRLARDLEAERAGLAKLVNRRTAAAEQAREEAESAAADLQAQVWLVTGLAQVSAVLRGTQDLAVLSNAVIAEVGRYVNAVVGALYLRDDAGVHLWGRYAYTLSPGQPTSFALGEGLVGKTAQDGRMRQVADIPDGQFVVASGLGESVLHHVLVVPFTYMDEVHGVLEFGAQHPFTPAQVAFVEQTLEPIAIAFNTAQNLTRINALLGQTRSQAEELRLREEELRAMNEELSVRH